jgi:hypothetical protein
LSLASRIAFAEKSAPAIARHGASDFENVVVGADCYFPQEIPGECFPLTIGEGIKTVTYVPSLASGRL